MRQTINRQSELEEMAAIGRAALRPGAAWLMKILERECANLEPTTRADKPVKQRWRQREAPDIGLTASAAGAKSRWANATQKQKDKWQAKMHAGKRKAAGKPAKAQSTVPTVRVKKTNSAATWWANATKKQKKERYAKMLAGRVAAKELVAQRVNGAAV